MSKCEKLKAALEQFPTVKITTEEKDWDTRTDVMYVTLKNSPEPTEKVKRWIKAGYAVMYDINAGRWKNFRDGLDPKYYMDFKFEGVK